ncbi:MAG TPA: M4 family metallopeptidase [Saprospiraceae bacterium]|nr:M4 family metallopeptidase [Saprospiraceae bacterium]HRO09303.1 M4 family metallopeptidase [Saprospiraceae bacterium]HRP42539.1 M4 family metallopeptidase [Saprospiraceae bacterium]
MKHHLIYSSFILLFLFWGLSAFGQNRVQKAEFIHEDANSFMKNVPSPLKDIADKIDADGTIHIKHDRYVTEKDILQLLSIKPEFSFSKKRENTSYLNAQKKYKYYQQFYKGIRVESGGYLIAEDTGKVSLFSPNLFTDIETDTTPEIPVSAFKSILTADSIYNSELIITNRFTKEFRLVWKVKYTDIEYKDAYIDALDGVVYIKQNQLIPLSANTRNYGTVQLNNYSDNGLSYLSSHDNRIKVFQNFNDMFYNWDSNLIPTTSDASTWDNSSAWVSSKQALYVTELVDQQFTTKLGITFPEIKVGTILKPNAHAIPNSNDIMVGTLNNNPNGANLALFDIIAHELGHHVVFTFIDYDPTYQNAVLHEGLADIIADYIENGILPSGTDWIMGNDDYDVKNFLDREHTSLYCFDPLTESPHESSKAISHWFYAITNGIQGSSIQPIGSIETSKNLALEALTRIVDPKAGIFHFKYQTMAVAKEMFGEHSSEYNSILNAWTRVCVDQQCTTNGQDLIITDYQSITQTRQYMGGNIIVESGGTLDILQSDIFLNDGKFIKIKSGGTLIIYSSKLNTCESQGAWNGIIIEEGGSVEFVNASIYNARTGIDIQGPLSSFQYDNVHIIGNSYSEVGLKFSSNGNYFYYKHNIKKLGDITGCQIGILSEYSSGIKVIRNADISYCHTAFNLHGDRNTIEHSNINDCYQGVFIDNGSYYIINNTTFDNCAYPVFIKNTFADISENTISGYFNTAINCEQSTVFIERNRIGSEIDLGSTGIRCYQSDGVIIADNSDIFANNGIKVLSTPGAVIAGNTIDIQTASTGIGIFTDLVDDGYITNNYIHVGYGFCPIFSRLTIDEEIINNHITFDQRSNIASAAFRGASNHGSKFSQNIIISPYNAPAVSLSNATYNTIVCNDIMAGMKGVEIKYNSDQHTIKGNILNTSKDIEIHSVIGPQPHHGNLFIGGTAEAIGLTQDELDLSKFTVNPNIAYHMPANPIPDNGSWFEIAYKPNPFNCTGVVIGPEAALVDSLCVYWSQLKRIRDTLPDRFFINVFHLLYRAQKDTVFRLPDCIRLDTVLTRLCGVSKAAEVFAALTRLDHSGSRSDTLRQYARQYVETSDASSKTTIRANMADVYRRHKTSILPSHLHQDSLRLDSLYTVIDEVACDSLIFQKWKAILKLYIQYKVRDSVRTEDRSEVLAYSRHCADRYGDAVYLARVMVATFSSEDFHLYDDCMVPLPVERIGGSVGDILQDVQVAPNPTDGYIRVDFSHPFTGKLFISDMTGKVYLTKTYHHVRNIELDLSTHAGMQFIQLLTDRGETRVYKVIVIK